MGYTRQIDDKEIYNRAVKENRFVVTINFKDFKKLVRSNRPGIIGLPSSLSNDDIDLVLAEYVSKHDPLECLGTVIKITHGDVAKIKKNR